ncbi:RNase adapter RapZ [Pseudomarimonas arenosa]|uniref:RNase adapter RapZ n=1 Tax=Pseudomarimonas arenosa TaxID=2774145 RepID=A0AAW3ZPY1_9GAMM|nr:RNase adapter RapZ [Pseudomarimonas arenosa]MBD8527162.1 RNase adapter RapZ [Pseudomarimonas arenosa]
MSKTHSSTAHDDTPKLGGAPLIIVSGLSGSGKSIALRTLEDLGCYCVDNLPSDLLPEFVASVLGGSNPPSRLAVGIDVRNRAEDLSHLPHALSEVGKMGLQHQLIFLDCRDEVLLKRYADTRRRHPLGREGTRLAEAIALERRLLKPLAAIADKVIDSSDLNVHQLRRLIITELELSLQQGLSILIESFAFRRGVPTDADFVFDGRCLPNPHWNPTLRPLSGRDAAVRDFFASETTVEAYFQQVADFIENWLPRFESETRSYITIAFGCSGGRHRSVYLAERLAERLRTNGRDHTLTFHREIE